MKIVVFDLDETLGYFTQFGIFYDSLIHCLHIDTLSDEDFDALLDLYPAFLRPNILPILHYLKKKKMSNCCHKMMIYTNNNGPRTWAKKIVGYFERKLKFTLIDQIIAAFKINGRCVEFCRTTHNKCHRDLIKCTKIPENAHICFIDDFYYPEMEDENIYYINIKPYYHDIPFNEMIQLFMQSSIAKQWMVSKSFIKDMNTHIQSFHYTVIPKDPKEYEIDKLLGKQIISHLYIFFNQTHKKTHKKHPIHTYTYYKNKTLKHKKIK